MTIEAPRLHPSTSRSCTNATCSKISIRPAAANTTCLPLSSFPTLTISRPLLPPLQVAKLLDPDRSLFNDRIVSRDDCPDLQVRETHQPLTTYTSAIYTNTVHRDAHSHRALPVTL